MDSLATTATTTDIRALNPRVAVLPVGSFEQHGDFLPLTTDTLIASAIARRIADDYGLFLLPPITFSCSHEHASYPGTVSISARTLIALIDDITASLSASGVDRLVIVNGHGGNYVLSNIVQEANIGGPRMILFPGKTDWTRAREAAGMETDHSEDMHAGELEVSVLLHTTPEQVRDSYKSGDHIANERPHLLSVGMPTYTSTGVIGRPSLASSIKGGHLLAGLSSAFKFHLDLML
ncbi:creatininase family protein [Parafrankia sp. EUN1f]|uniref:creatininase family protein n=1 Tax=Parafrankia sp. EUN1f TaxID=102897 RepID=UPI0001C45F05|nr:creatininase family protein [Parafrankia sp. EUN1f]EFC81781.1 Creatininase [Parafrankia sp. EUN1f]